MTQLLVKLARRNPRKPDYVKIAALETNLGLPSTVSERDKLRAQWNDPYRENSYVARQRAKRRRKIRIGAAATRAVILFLFAFWYVTFHTEAFTEPVHPLPAGVLVGPSASFVVPKGQDGLGAVLCDDASFESKPLGKRVLVNCTEGSPKFSYPKSAVWRP